MNITLWVGKYINHQIDINFLVPAEVSLKKGDSVVEAFDTEEEEVE